MLNTHLGQLRGAIIWRYHFCHNSKAFLQKVILINKKEAFTPFLIHLLTSNVSAASGFHLQLLSDAYSCTVLHFYQSPPLFFAYLCYMLMWDFLNHKSSTGSFARRFQWCIKISKGIFRKDSNFMQQPSQNFHISKPLTCGLLFIILPIIPVWSAQAKILEFA